MAGAPSMLGSRGMNSIALFIPLLIVVGAAIMLDTPGLARRWRARRLRRTQEQEAEALECAASLPGLASRTRETLRDLRQGADDLADADASD
jgi:hypothetical protein